MHRSVKWITVLALAALPRAALAVDCSTLPNPIYVQGSSAVQPFIQQMSATLSTQANPVTLIYLNSGSCTGVNAIVAGTLATGMGTYYTGNPQTATMCTLPTAGQAVDVGVSDVFGKFCLGSALPSGFTDFRGPAQAMCFAVPKASSQQALVAEEGYMVFGFPDDQGGVMPWLSNMFKFIRNMTSGTQGILSSSIGVPTAKVQGMDGGSNGGVLTDVTGSTNPEATIGMLAASFYDAHRDTLTQLAFRAFKQYFAYYADSTPSSFDKQNVRDGHYLPFGYVHMIAATDTQGVPTNPKAKMFVDWVLGNTGTNGTPAPFDITAVAVAAHVIPLCAMHVQRSEEGGDLSLYSDSDPCDCFFVNAATGQLPSNCTACSQSAPCSTGVCRHGFCEPR